MSAETRRNLAAEAIGSFFLFATVIGSGIMAERLADGNVAIALLGNTLAIGARPFDVRRDISPDTIRRKTMQNIAEFHIIGRIGKIDAAKDVSHLSVAAAFKLGFRLQTPAYRFAAKA